MPRFVFREGTLKCGHNNLTSLHRCSLSLKEIIEEVTSFHELEDKNDVLGGFNVLIRERDVESKSK
jgi:hypothetical protein